MSESATTSSSKRSNKRKSEQVAPPEQPAAASAAVSVSNSSVSPPTTVPPTTEKEKKGGDSDGEVWDELDPCRGGRRSRRGGSGNVCARHSRIDCTMCDVSTGESGATNSATMAAMEAVTDRLGAVMEKLHKFEVTSAIAHARDSGITNGGLSACATLRGRSEQGMRDFRETVDSTFNQRSVARSVSELCESAFSRAAGEKKDGQGLAVVSVDPNPLYADGGDWRVLGLSVCAGHGYDACIGQAGGNNMTTACWKCGRGNHAAPNCVALTRNVMGKDMTLPLATRGGGFGMSQPLYAQQYAIPAFAANGVTLPNTPPVIQQPAAMAPVPVFGASRRGGGGGGVCFRCGQQGHLARDCSAVFGQQQQQPNVTTNR